MDLKKLNKRYGFPEDMAWVICKTCGKRYPSQMEEDYSDDCSDCEELSLIERLEIKNKRNEILIGGLIV